MEKPNATKLKNTETENLKSFTSRLTGLGTGNEFSQFFTDSDTVENCISSANSHSERLRKFAEYGDGFDFAHGLANRWKETAMILSCPFGVRKAIEFIDEI